MRFLTSLLAVSLLVPCPSLSAQLPTIATGARTRVAYECSEKSLYGGNSIYECLTATGRLSTLSVDSVVLSGDHESSQVTVPFASLVTFELSRGERSQQEKFAGIGGFIGGSAGLAISAARCSSSSANCTAEDIVLTTSFLAAPAIALGAILGDHWKEKWESVPLGWVRLSAMRESPGVAFGAAMTF